MQWLGAVREGLPGEMIDTVLAEGRLTAAEIDRLAPPRKTLAHRRTLGRLTPVLSDRLARIPRVIEAAEETFGEPGKAHTWLRRPTIPLDGQAPLDLLDTDIGEPTPRARRRGRRRRPHTDPIRPPAMVGPVRRTLGISTAGA